ncbi:hypothetical protein NIES4071_103610 (plasmid) [Calothrix sp. NIES-4071]|nr:hypothetical protein NIES4071_103610 [Calothrix sp. NIES-4071]BAZ64348.1 hypothetical protein NIES4105_100810 [Calothrix sp. NIES-4105]
MKKEKAQLKDIVMTADMGGSKTKIVVQELGNKEHSLLLMDSSLADIGKASLDLAPTEGRSSDRAWVGYKGEGEEYLYYAVGALARNRFGGFSQLHELKYELALPKILAAIWSARVELELPAKFNLYLCVLLPAGEMRDKDILKSRLIDAVQSFETPDGKMGIKMRSCEVSPEGSGIYHHRKNVLSDEFNERRQLYVMVGYRNASAFIVRGGVIEPGITSDLGMSWMLDYLTKRVSGLDKNNPNLVEIIVNSAHSPEVLKKLSRKRRKEDIETDYELITNAVAASRDEYVRLVVRWLKSIPGEFDVNAVCPQDEVVMCGGTAEYLRGELDKYYSDGTEIVWHGGVSVPSEYESKLGSSRLADVWALHEVFYKLVAARLNVAASKPNADASKGDGADTKNFVLQPRRVERPAGTLPPIVS